MPVDLFKDPEKRRETDPVAKWLTIGQPLLNGRLRPVLNHGNPATRRTRRKTAAIHKPEWRHYRLQPVHAEDLSDAG